MIPIPSPHTSFFHKSIFIISLCLIFQPGWLFATQKKNAIRVGIFQNKPLSYTDDQGVAQGIYPDVIREIAKVEKWKLKFVVDSWSGNLERLKVGNIDLMVSIVYSKERDKIFDFSQEPVVTAWGQLYTMKGSGIISILNLNGKNVAVMKKDINAKHLMELCRKFNVKPNFIYVKIYDDVCELVVSKEVDAGVINNINGEFLKRKYNIHPTPIMFSPVLAVFAAPEGKNHHLLDRIDFHLSRWRNDKNSVYYSILNRWYGDIEKRFQFPYKIIAIIISIAAGISLFLFIWMNILRSQVKSRTKELRDSEEKYRELIEGTDDLITKVGKDSKLLFVNYKSNEVFGLSPKDCIGLSAFEFIYPADRKRSQKWFEDIVAVQKKSGTIENRQVSRNGKINHIFWTSNFHYAANGTLLGVNGIGRDIAERKIIEEKVKGSLKEKEVLLREVHHRVKNNMQVIISLLRLQADKIKDKKYADMLKESQDRIKSMSLVHEKLYQSKDFANIDFNEYVESLINSLSAYHVAHPNQISFKNEIENISFDIENAIPCGLVINELVTNSLKYAFPQGREGEIKIILRPINENEFKLTVSDDGIGMPEDLDFDNTETLGLDLTKTIIEHQLDGTIELDRTIGTTFHILFKRQMYKART